MNNVNKLDKNNSNQKKSNRLGKIPYIFALSTILSIANPSEMKANTLFDKNQEGVEVVTNSNIASNIERRTWVILPNPYAQKLENIISNNTVMQDRGSAKYIEDFIVKEMQKNRWISKENQLLFIWTHIYKEISNKYLYDWSDGDDNRLNEYSDAIEQVEESGRNFRNWYIAYTKQRSADADRKSAEYDRRSADADREIIRGTNSRLNNLVKFYNLYKINPSSIKQNEINHMMRSAKEIVQDCKEYGIDYKTKLPLEVRKFYGIN